MGGCVALAFARRHAARLRGLVLVDLRAETDDDTVKANRTRMIENASTLTMTAVMDTMIPRVLGATTLANRPEVVARVREIGTKQTMVAVVGGQTALRDRPDARPGLADIRVPTLVIGGSEDVITPPLVVHSIADAIAGSQLAILDQVGHLPNLEAPDRFNATVAAFLRNVPGGKSCV
jgi:3-oxoadipate enol-lactonase